MARVPLQRGVRPRLPSFSNPGKLAKEETEVIIDAKEGFKFGCDPEIFIKDKDGCPVSAFAAGVPGSKVEPMKCKGGAIQRDGMAAEINIDPVTTFAAFNRNIEDVLKELRAIIGDKYELVFDPFIRFPAEAFDEIPDEDKVLGCNPDMNAWTGDINPPPSPEMIGDPFLRTAGGHLHFGWTTGADLADPQHVMNCRDLARQLDWYLGYWSLKMDPDPTRRLLYGGAGACRYKDYGVEYRALSNFWLTTRERRLAVWNRMQQAIYDMRHGFLPDKSGTFYNGLLVESINSSNRSSSLEHDHRFPLMTADPSYSRF